MTVAHDNCGGELVFVRMRDTHKHNWKAVCTKCYSKKGSRKMIAWVSERQIDLIVEHHPSTKLEVEIDT